MSNILIENLKNPDLFSHAISEFKICETQSSLVLTTGEYVYKIKKPVDFGFLNYSSLEKRLYFCQREIELNSKFAKDIYLGVVAIYGDENHPSFEARGEPFEYAVKMRQFPQENILSQQLLDNKVSPDVIDKLAKTIADFHQHAEVAKTDVAFGDAKHIHKFAMDNFSETLAFLKSDHDIAQLKKLETMMQSCYDAIKGTLQQRKIKGFVRHCHGDMHLNNIVLLNQQPVIFDCIEFNEDFVWTDLMGDLGFIIMGLDEHNKPELAHLLLNRYLELTGDYSALKVLAYFCAYRAMVRAKLDQIHLSQPSMELHEQQQVKQHYQTYLGLVEQYLQVESPTLMITHGFCASGKSTVARQIVSKTGAIQLRSDVERKRLANLALTADSQSALYDGLYKTETTTNVYQHLAEIAQQIIESGYSVVVDAAFIRQDLRQIFIDLAQKLNVPFKILSCQAPESTLRQWIAERSKDTNEISEGRLEILEHQLKNHDPLTAEEKPFAFAIDSTKAFSIDQILQGTCQHD